MTRETDHPSHFKTVEPSIVGACGLRTEVLDGRRLVVLGVLGRLDEPGLGAGRAGRECGRGAEGEMVGRAAQRAGLGGAGRPGRAGCSLRRLRAGGAAVGFVLSLRLGPEVQLALALIALLLCNNKNLVEGECWPQPTV